MFEKFDEYLVTDPRVTWDLDYCLYCKETSMMYNTFYPVIIHPRLKTIHHSDDLKFSQCPKCKKVYVANYLKDNQ